MAGVNTKIVFNYFCLQNIEGKNIISSKSAVRKLITNFKREKKYQIFLAANKIILEPKFVCTNRKQLAKASLM